LIRRKGDKERGEQHVMMEEIAGRHLLIREQG
jgi:hypothetical protein